MLVTTWVTHWVMTTTGSSSLSCAVNTNYIIAEAKFNISSAYNNTLLLKVTSKGNEQLYGFGVILDNGTRVLILRSNETIINQGGISSTSKLKREESVYITVNLTNSTLYYPGLGATLSEIKVINDACPAVSTSTTTITKGSW
jgi:hypothetical protein